MKPFVSLQGTITPGGSTLFTVPTGGFYTVPSMRFNNPAAYTLIVEKYQASTSLTTTVYSLNLAAGDTVTDTYVYYFDPGDQLIIDSSIAGTIYMINLIAN